VSAGNIRAGLNLAGLSNFDRAVQPLGGTTRVFYRFRITVQNRSAQRWVRLVVEELESRQLLSGGSVLAQPLPTDMRIAVQTQSDSAIPAPIVALSSSNESGNSHSIDTSLSLSDLTPILATPEVKSAFDSGGPIDISLDVESARVLTPGETIFLVDSRSDSLPESPAAMVCAPSPGLGGSSVWTEPGAALGPQELSEPGLGAIDFSSPVQAAGSAGPSVFSTLETGDWQRMVESTWGYRPGSTISSELARTVHYAKADVSDSGLGSSISAESILGLSIDEFAANVG
jgi:hypothetical protein